MQNIKVYRYMWLVKGNDNMFVRVLAGVDDEHKHFIENLTNNDEVINACRVYLHEIDINLVEEYESIKFNKKECDENEKS